jgi:hypothetical protein
MFAAKRCPFQYESRLPIIRFHTHDNAFTLGINFMKLKLELELDGKL